MGPRQERTRDLQPGYGARGVPGGCFEAFIDQSLWKVFVFLYEMKSTLLHYLHVYLCTTSLCLRFSSPVESFSCMISVDISLLRTFKIYGK